MPDYRRLKVWQKARELASEVYRISTALPETERYGLQSQMRRASVSIASNVAEGSGRSTDRDFARFIAQAIGSACELECQLIIAGDLGYLPVDLAKRTQEKISEVRRMLRSFRGRLTQPA